MHVATNFHNFSDIFGKCLVWISAALQTILSISFPQHLRANIAAVYLSTGCRRFLYTDLLSN